MKFEVVKDGQPVFITEHEECVYPRKTLRQMSKSGYTFRIDGKRASLDKAVSLSKSV